MADLKQAENFSKGTCYTVIVVWLPEHEYHMRITAAGITFEKESKVT